MLFEDGTLVVAIPLTDKGVKEPILVVDEVSGTLLGTGLTGANCVMGVNEDISLASIEELELSGLKNITINREELLKRPRGRNRL